MSKKKNEEKVEEVLEYIEFCGPVDQVNMVGRYALWTQDDGKVSRGLVVDQFMCYEIYPSYGVKILWLDSGDVRTTMHGIRWFDDDGPFNWEKEKPKKKKTKAGAKPKK